MFGSGNVIHMHQIVGFDDISVLPAARYLERALLLGGCVCVTSETDTSIVPWLKEVDLAPDEIIRVPHKCMFTGLREDASLLAEVQTRFAQGARPMFFRPTELEAGFIEGLGLTWEKTASCEPRVAEAIGAKDFLRKLAASIGSTKAFPPHTILYPPWDADQVMDAVADMNQQARDMRLRNVMAKRTDLVSGEGMIRTGSYQFRQFLSKNRDHALIVEVEIDPHVPISNQWFVQDGKAIYVGASRQLQDGFVHKGNVIASDDRVLPEGIVRRLLEMTQPLVIAAMDMGYNGVIGFDAVWNQERDWIFLTEANARVTASTYPFAVAHRLGFAPWAVANKMVVPAAWCETFNSVRGHLGSLLYSPRRHHGVVPYMIGALTHPTMRRMGLMAIAEEQRQSEQLLAEAERRLTELRG